MQRSPEQGETCECGRPAVVVYQFEDREIPHCGVNEQPEEEK